MRSFRSLSARRRSGIGHPARRITAGLTALVLLGTTLVAMVAALAPAQAVAGLSIAAVGGTPQTTPVNTAFPVLLSAKVTNNGAPVNGASVDFVAPAAGASGNFSSPNSGSTDTLVGTGQDGVASVAFFANGTTGAYNVDATTIGGANTAVFCLGNGVAATCANSTGIMPIQGATQITPPNSLFPSALVARVTDLNGVAQVGVQVTFTAPASGPSGTFANGTTVQSVTTDNSGDATVEFTANAISGGPYQVTATTPSVSSPATFSLTNGTGASIGVPNQIAGTTADATVAREFEDAYPSGNASVVLATDLDPFDALAASYLEGRLNTGLLITPPGSLGADAAAAMRQEGVATVYVVGGPFAVSANVLSQIRATPAYQAGGTTLTGSNIQVAASTPGGSSGAIFGASADDTAQAIATYFGAAGAGTASFSGAYGTGSTGLYNDTTGSGTLTGPSAAVATAILVSDSSFQDAVSAGPMAFWGRFPVLLTAGTSAGLSSQAAAALSTLGIQQVIVIGGPLAVGNGAVAGIQGVSATIAVLRIAGQDATDTAGQLALFELASAPLGLAWNTSAHGLLIGNGDVDGSDALAWGDLLGAAALGGSTGSAFGLEPILQVDGATVGPYTTAILHSAGSPAGIQGDVSIRNLNVLGGQLAMSPAVVAQLQADLAAG